MRSTGEVMGVADYFGTAFDKAQIAAGNALPLSGAMCIKVNDHDKPEAEQIAERFTAMGVAIAEKDGTANYMRHHV